MRNFFIVRSLLTGIIFFFSGDTTDLLELLRKELLCERIAGLSYDSYSVALIYELSVMIYKWFDDFSWDKTASVYILAIAGNRLDNTFCYSPKFFFILYYIFDVSFLFQPIGLV